MGKPKDPAYWRNYRASHPEYAASDRDRSRVRKARAPRGDRSAEYAARRSRATPVMPLGILFPDLAHGSAMSFWEDELRMDLAQEAALARLERRDVEVAVEAYRRREMAWRAITVPLEPVSPEDDDVRYTRGIAAG